MDGRQNAICNIWDLKGLIKSSADILLSCLMFHTGTDVLPLQCPAFLLTLSIQGAGFSRTRPFFQFPYRTESCTAMRSYNWVPNTLVSTYASLGTPQSAEASFVKNCCRAIRKSDEPIQNLEFVRVLDLESPISNFPKLCLNSRYR